MSRNGKSAVVLFGVRSQWLASCLVACIGCGSDSGEPAPVAVPSPSPSATSPSVAPDVAAGEPPASPEVSGGGGESVLPDDTPLAPEVVDLATGAVDAVPDASPPEPPPAGTDEPESNFPVSEGTPVAYLAGDSTVQTYGAGQAPQQGWGQRLQELFTNGVMIANRAIGGRSSKSYIDEGRLDGIVAEIKQGDYLFAQWGINDRYRSDPTRFTDPATTFKQYLQMYVDAARSKNAIPVLVTPTPRLDYVDGVFKNDFEAYCTAIKEVGAATNTTVIDLQTKGLAYYTSVGIDYVEAEISLDVLHFKVEGAHQMARLVAQGVRESDLPIAAFVK